MIEIDILKLVVLFFSSSSFSADHLGALS